MTNARRLVVAVLLVGSLMVAGHAAAGWFVVREIYPGNWPLGVLVDSDRGLIYVANAKGADVGVFETVSLRQVTRIPTGSHAVELALDGQRQRLYVTNSFSRSLSVIDTLSHAVIATLPMPQLPHGLALDPLHGLVLVVSPHTAVLTVVDADTLTVTGTVQVPGGHKIDVDADTGLAYVARFDGLMVVDPVALSVVRTIPTGDYTNDVAVDALRDRAYVSSAARDSVGIVDLAAGGLVGEVAVGDHAVPLAIDAATGLVYVGVRDGVDVVDPVTRTHIGHADADPIPSYIDVDPSTHLVYATNANYYSLAVIDDDFVPPQSTIETRNLSILRERNYYEGEPVVGSSTDDYSGISAVDVTFAPPGQRPPARVTCDAMRRSCRWEARPPSTPGIYEVTVAARDRAGNPEAEPERITIIVLPG